jgi:hypothetical protein
MKDLFVPYELALLAKEKGFDERSVAYYMIWGTETHHYIQGDGSANGQKQVVNGQQIHCLSPLYQQLQQWFLEKHNLYIQYPLVKDKYFYDIWKIINKGTVLNERVKFSSKGYREPHTAYIKAFEYLFKLL